MVLLFVSSGLRGVPGGVNEMRLGAKQGPGTPSEKFNSDFGANTGRYPGQKRDLGVAQRNAQRCWGVYRGVKYLHLSFAFEDAREIQHARYLD